MMQRSKQLFILLTLGVWLICPVFAWAVNVGEKAPEFTLNSLDDKPVSLADFKGQVVLLKLATTWCPTCKELTAEIGKADQFLQENNVVVLEVFVQDSPEMVVRYNEDKTYTATYHSLVDDGQAYRAYNVYLIPRLVVIDPAGVVTFDSAGQNVTADRLQDLVAEALPAPKAEQAAEETN